MGVMNDVREREEDYMREEHEARLERERYAPQTDAPEYIERSIRDYMAGQGCPMSAAFVYNGVLNARQAGPAVLPFEAFVPVFERVTRGGWLLAPPPDPPDSDRVPYGGLAGDADARGLK